MTKKLLCIGKPRTHHQELVSHKEIKAPHNEVKERHEMEAISHKEFINIVDEVYAQMKVYGKVKEHV